MQRRQFITTSGLAMAAIAMPFGLRAASTDARQGLVSSDLVYISPIRRNGALSSCQAEVWFITLGPSVYVCTASSSWRSRAVRKGLTDTQLWVGDRGVWRSGKYRSLPKLKASGGVETASEKIDAALAQFGRKYAAEWGIWGPRFRNGLEDGSRTMLRYDLSV